ncbi:phage tail collar domain-containing protein [Caballeronia catudaia]|uniref:Phage tail collar domain-containing protein n=1 Tax=Caballeronia catudaia TaxID=1777136 RepID=A0A158D1B4_9BURK|nr:tail fiber protein [Caballeronia catudaia]SAK88016.1 phage tail collar domain-containing protein [Caballeronia catudaia]
MQADQSPALVTLPFAANALRNVIPESSQTGVAAGAASLNDGFPPATMQPKTQGGVPPDGKDFNGILFLLSAVARWMQAGGSFAYDPAFKANPNLGGYPRGATVLRADLNGFWFNTTDNNTTNPDAKDGSARNWIALNADWNAASGPGAIQNRPTLAKVATTGQYSDLSGTPTAFIPPGALLPFMGSAVPVGYLLANGAAVSRQTYAALFAAIGTTYGAGNGSTTFNLPDTRGVCLRGLDNGRGLDPGRALGSYQADSYAWHGHGVSDPGHAHGVADPGHAHGVYDPGHGHGVGDPGHSHSMPAGGWVQSGTDNGGSCAVSPPNQYGAYNRAINNTNSNGTGIWIGASNANIGIYGSGTGIGIYGSGTGISIVAAGGAETRGKNLPANFIIAY